MRDDEVGVSFDSPIELDDTPVPAAAASSSSAASSAPAHVQSRSGRAVKPTEIFTVVPEPTKKMNKKGHNNTGKKKKGKHPPVVAEPYHGEGFTVRDHSWYPDYKKPKYASPAIEKIDQLYKRISCESACQQAGLTMTRSLQVDLRNSTIAKLKAVLSSETEKGEKDRIVLAACENGEARSCALYQSDPNDADSIKVVTTAFVRSGDVICVYMGRLVEADQFYSDYGDRSLFNVSSYDIPKELLPDKYSGPALLLDTNVCANEAKFIRDARWDDNEISPNVQTRIVWNHARGLPFVAMIALGDIEADAELFVDWGDQAWSVHARNKLHRMAHLSYGQHFRLRQLQRELAKKGVQPYADMHKAAVKVLDDVAFEDFHFVDDDEEMKQSETQPPPAAAAASSSNNQPAAFSSHGPPAASDVTEIIGTDVIMSDGTSAVSKKHRADGKPRTERIMRRKPRPSEPPSFILRNTKHVFANSGCFLLEKCDYSSLSEEARVAWEKAAKKSNTHSLTKHQHSESLKEVLATGRTPKAGVYEVVSLRHPARFYSPPDCSSYALLARQTIERYEPIGVYIGKVHEAKIFHADYQPEDRIKQVYAYDMNASLFDCAKPSSAAAAANGDSEKELPDLICESLSVGGNEMRYVNDSWSRAGGTKTKNAEPWPIFDPVRNMPVIVIRAIRKIEKGEEIVTDYGETFWCKISTALSMEHSMFQAKCSQQILECEKQLKQLLGGGEAPAASSAAAASAAASLLPAAFSPPHASSLSPSPSPTASSASMVAGIGVTSVLASSAAPADDLLPTPPNRWKCYRELFNQFDVYYQHRTPPVRLDKVIHHDQFVVDHVNETLKIRREARQLAAAKAARAAARQKAAEAKKKEAPAVSKPSAKQGRVSERGVIVAQRAAESAAQEKEVRIRLEAEKKAAEVSRAEKRAAKKLAEEEARLKQDLAEIEAFEKRRSQRLDSSAAPAAAAAAASSNCDDMADVIDLSSPTPSASSTGIFARHTNDSFPCSCGGIATWRTLGVERFKACHSCYKARCDAEDVDSPMDISDEYESKSSHSHRKGSNVGHNNSSSPWSSSSSNGDSPPNLAPILPISSNSKRSIEIVGVTVCEASNNGNELSASRKRSRSSGSDADQTTGKSAARSTRSSTSNENDASTANTSQSPRTNTSMPFKRAKLDESDREVIVLSPEPEESKHNPDDELDINHIQR